MDNSHEASNGTACGGVAINEAIPHHGSDEPSDQIYISGAGQIKVGHLSVLKVAIALEELKGGGINGGATNAPRCPLQQLDNIR